MKYWYIIGVKVSGQVNLVKYSEGNSGEIKKETKIETPVRTAHTFIIQGFNNHTIEVPVKEFNSLKGKYIRK